MERTNVRQLIYRFPTFAPGLFQEWGQFFVGPKGYLLRQFPGREGLENIVHHQVQILTDGCDGTFGFLWCGLAGASDNTFRGGKTLDGEMAFTLGPAMGSAVRINREVEMSIG